MNLKDLAYHAIVGNDTPPWIVAAARGTVLAFITAGIAFFQIWAQTDDIKLLISVPGTTFLTVLSGRWVAEGIIDTWKNGGS